MKLEIQTYDKGLVFELFGKSSVSVNDAIEIPGDTEIIFEGKTFFKAIGIPDTINLMLNFGGGVAAGIVANWIYDKLKNKTEKIIINRKEVQLDREEIKKIIEETIEIER